MNNNRYECVKFNNYSMNNYLESKVINQSVGNIPVENYLADLLLELEKKEVNLELADAKMKVMKQLNNRHKNIIDAQRVMLKQAEFEQIKI